MLQITDLHVEIDGKKILNGVSLTIKPGERVALMGPNGSGKSTLAYTLMGHPKYVVTRGTMKYNGVDIVPLSPDERARLGLFLSFQYPASISGVTVSNFLRQAMLAQGKRLSIPAFRKELLTRMAQLGIPESFADRSVNQGFSGGEKKRLEILQLSLLAPTLAILDETDSGLDIDAIRVVAQGVNRAHEANPVMSTLVITHYQRILHFLQPDSVYVLSRGVIVKSGGPELVAELEKKGYGWITGEL
jgi:Fe-S cluster assembly ATP-binding protein